MTATLAFFAIVVLFGAIMFVSVWLSAPQRFRWYRRRNGGHWERIAGRYGSQWECVGGQPHTCTAETNSAVVDCEDWP